ncbi:MAG: ATP-dependent helicase [Thermoproteota archaeon]
MTIEFIGEPFSKEESLDCLEDHVRDWFLKNFEELTPPQQYSFKLISQGKNVIVTAPTGSGKTLAGFMVIISEIFKMSFSGMLHDGVYCLYVSPLKALDNDIKKNLLIPLTQIGEEAKSTGKELPEIRIAVRTGDVPTSEKQKQLRNPPHILITTPESIAILLNAPKFATHLKTIRWVIVDEIHELANSKRGVHLSLSLERLEHLVGRSFVRIGLGATLHPLEEAAMFLVGYEDSGIPRSCSIVDVSWSKPFDLGVLSPLKDIVNASASQLNTSMYKLLDKLISRHRTTLIFTNTRSGTERVVYHLKRRWRSKYTDATIGAHHGSLSREARLDVENRLKQGLFKAVVCSTSLELGIDIGSIDLVVQIGSPKSVTRAVQRIGRSGHGFHDVAVGRIIVLDRDDLVECSVMLRCAMERNLDRIQIPVNCLDILSQHLVGMSLNSKWRVDEALRIVRRSYCYHALSRQTLISVLHYLAGHYSDLEDRRVYGKIWFDEKDGVFGRRGRYTRVIYYLNIGAIPDEVKITVKDRVSKKRLGNIEEGFLERLRPNDIFVLGGRLYRFRYARGMTCYVEEAPRGSSPTIPSWFSELLPLSWELASEIRRFRSMVKQELDKGTDRRNIIAWLQRTLPIDRYSASSIYEYFREQYRYLNGKIPTEKVLLVERTRDLRGRKFIIFHALFGRRTNDALSRAFATILSERIEASIGITVSDNGFALLVPEDAQIDVRQLANSVQELDLEKYLRENIRRTELMKRRFRHCASRSFLVLRNYKGYEIGVSKQQISSQILLSVTEKIDPNFPVLEETYREILMDTMDLEHAREVVEMMRKGDLTIDVVDTEIPSPFAHNLIVLGEADIILMKDRKRHLLQLYEAVMRKIRGEEMKR